MRVGISTACFYPHYNTEDTLEIIKKLGFNICETFLETEYEITEKYCRFLREKADRLNLEIYSTHAFAVAFEPFLFDRYPRRKKEMEHKFRSMCMAANILGAKYYTFHGTRKPKDCICDVSYTAQGMDRLCKIAGEYNVKIAWENVSWCSSSSSEFVKKVLDEMNEDIRFTLDIKQAVRSGELPESYLNVYGKRLTNVHINDSDCNNTCLLPGCGDMDLGKIIKNSKAKNPDVPFIIEVYCENYNSFDDIVMAKNYVESLGE